MSGLILVNGVPSAQVDARDRGLQYGDGLFETMALIDGRVRRFEAHWARLQLGCRRLGLPCPERATIETEVAHLAATQDRAVLKLILTRGPGERGYRPPEQPVITRILWREAWPPHPLEAAQRGVVVRLCRTTLGEQPALAGIKHLNRLEQVLARAEWQADGVEAPAEGLMLDGAGHLVGGTMSNVFLVCDGKLLTPSLERCGVAGTVRAAALAAAREFGIPTQETLLGPQALREAQEIFLTNALIGLWPVRHVDGQSYPVGPVTRRLQALV